MHEIQSGKEIPRDPEVASINVTIRDIPILDHDEKGHRSEVAGRKGNNTIVTATISLQKREDLE